jgi:hypothetical protein
MRIAILAADGVERIELDRRPSSAAMMAAMRAGLAYRVLTSCGRAGSGIS